MFKKLKALRDEFKSEVAFYRRVLTDKRVPRPAKWLLGLAIAYMLSPIDLIPDFIPVLGYLDDAVVVPLLIWLALRMIPREIVAEARLAARNPQSLSQSEES